MMGTMFTAVNHERRAAFELGKWLGFPENKDEWPLTEKGWLAFVTEWLSTYPVEQRMKIASELHRFQADECFSDHQDLDELYCDYVFTHSVFPPETNDVGRKLGKTAAEFECIPVEWLETGNPDNPHRRSSDGNG